MAGKSPRKSEVAGKQPSNLKRLKHRSLGGKAAPVLSKTGTHARPRRFSLIYSSDSSLSALSDLENKKKLGFKNPKLTRKAKRGVSNEMGKTGKLIHGSVFDSDEGSSAYSTASDSGENDDDDDDDDDNDDPNGYSSSSSSSDDDVDLVKLSAERKKRAMQAMTALKRGKSPKKTDTLSKKESKVKTEHSNSDGSDDDAMAFNFKKDDGIRFGHVSSEEVSDEDLGEEVADERRANKSVALKSNHVDQLNVPQISESEDSDYDIDRDAYFKTIESDNENVTGFETGLETGEDDLPILDEEEQNIVMELENADDLSFDGSIHEEGEDPVEAAQNGKMKAGDNQSVDDYDEEEDDIMSDLDMPFYEDPKFANLYYCAGSDQPLSLSTSLPLILNDEKRKKLDKKQTKRREREELAKRRKQLKSLRKRKRDHAAATDVEGEDYLFSVFFHSDDGKDHNQELESQLRQLGSAAPSNTDYSTDEEYENILLDIAHIPTDDESLDGIGGEIDLDDEDYDDDDVSMSNVFIDIDDLDPDSFYFQYESSESDSDIGGSHDDSRGEKKENKPNEVADMETVIYVDDESTDEDETLPPPNSRGKKIGSKAKEVVSANVVGLKPPKLGTWETDNKPFSIIDGLSTKSLYPLLQEQQILEQQLQQQQLPMSDLSAGGEKEELTLNELLNMSELEDDEGPKAAVNSEIAVSEWYDKPKVPLSAFRNKGIDVSQDEEYMVPVFSARKFPIGYVGSERTRRKIDRMKELQKKKNEERRKFKKKKKLLKLKRERERLEKERALNGDVVTAKEGDTPASNTLLSPSSQHEPENPAALVLPRKDSIKGFDLDAINNLLNRGDTDLIPHVENGIDLLENEDADILASLTAPVNIDTLDGKSMTTGAVWRRRQSIVEAAAENLRFTKSGLFSESALADLDQIIGTSNGSLIEFNDILQ